MKLLVIKFDRNLIFDDNTVSQTLAKKVGKKISALARNSFHVTGLFIYPLKTSEKFKFVGVIERGQWVNTATRISI